jgi:hypothetical protein
MRATAVGSPGTAEFNGATIPRINTPAGGGKARHSDAVPGRLSAESLTSSAAVAGPLGIARVSSLGNPLTRIFELRFGERRLEQILRLPHHAS